MARIDALPSIDIILGLKGILDFYLWRGLPCVRAWPKYRPARQTDASLAAALLFGAIVKSYSLLADDALAAYREDALDQPRTARDIMVTGVYGNLHEASMSDFLDLLTQCRDFLSSLTDLLHALDSIDTDEIVVNVDQSVLPPLAATTTNQATQTTALQKIDDLQDTLESKALDRLLVRGMDQLISYDGDLAYQNFGNPSGADGYWDSGAPGAGQIWKLTAVSIMDLTRAITRVTMYKRSLTKNYCFHDSSVGWAAEVHEVWLGEIWLEPGELVRIVLTGCQAADTVYCDLHGHSMTLET